jgi:two-component system, NarL family, sensor kinase
LLIEDNGKGFDKNILLTSKGNGWHNIQSRLELIHGTIEIDSQPGNGTVVHIEVPLKENAFAEINL